MIAELSTPPVSKSSLKAQLTATRIRWTWLGQTIKAEDDTRSAAVQTLADDQGGTPDDESFNLTKRLYNLKIPSLRELQRFKSKVIRWWIGQTIPYVEPGIRLLKRDDLEFFNEAMDRAKNKLADLAEAAQADRDTILADARERLRKGFNPHNYPDDLAALFGIEWSFPSIEPPDYLRTFNPEIYQQEKQRAEARFNEAIQLAEQAFAQQFAQLVDALHHALTPATDGKRKILKDAAVTNFQAFIEKFQKLSVHSSNQLDELVDSAKNLLSGLQPEDFRTTKTLKDEVANGLAQIKSNLTPLVIPLPRRRGIQQLNPTPTE